MSVARQALAVAVPDIAPLPAPAPVGTGSSIAHHGELFQGVVETPSLGICRCLVSLPAPNFQSRVNFEARNHEPLRVQPVFKQKALRAARLALDALGMGTCGGILEIKSNIPPRWGLGSSTTDVIASIRAVARAADVQFVPETVARLAVEAETASDSTMFGNQAVLFAQRRGIVIESFGGSLPAFEVLGFNTDPTGEGVDTLSFEPARYSWREIEAFRPLVASLRRAAATRDSRLLAEVASASARINQRHLPKPHFDLLERAAEDCGALGIQAAHSGTVVGFLFRVEDPDLDCRVADAADRLAAIGFQPAWRFRSANELTVVA